MHQSRVNLCGERVSPVLADTCTVSMHQSRVNLCGNGGGLPANLSLTCPCIRAA